MPIDRKLVQRRAHYTAVVTGAGTPIKATITADEVLLQRPGARSVLHVPVKEFRAFHALVIDVITALNEKLAVETATVPLPWETPAVQAIVAALPGGPDDAHSAPPAVPSQPAGTPIPPRVSA